MLPYSGGRKSIEIERKEGRKEGKKERKKEE
jgi:hypothetical protein